MEMVTGEAKQGDYVIHLSGHVDSGNAKDVDSKISTLETEEVKDKELFVDCEKLEYISNAGLRVILRLLKAHKGLSLFNVSTEVYEVLEMTEFTEMLPVTKAFRNV